MKLFSKLLSFFGKKKHKPKMGDIKLSGTKEYLAAVALKSVKEPSLEDSVRMVMLSAYNSKKSTKLIYRYNFKSKTFSITVKMGKDEEFTPTSNNISLAEVKEILNFVLQIEAENGRATEHFSYGMILNALESYIGIGVAYLNRYRSDSTYASVVFDWRYNPDARFAATKSSVGIGMTLRRDGTGRMHHNYIVSLTEVSVNKQIAA